MKQTAEFIREAEKRIQKQIILQRGIPFELKLPSPNVPGMSKMTQENLNVELEIGWKDVLNGRTASAEKLFSDLRKNTDYELCCLDFKRSTSSNTVSVFSLAMVCPAIWDKIGIR